MSGNHRFIKCYFSQFCKLILSFRKNCFTTNYFKGCLDALQLTDEMDQIQTWIKQLHGAELGV